jgi:hypothetical protein
MIQPNAARTASPLLEAHRTISSEIPKIPHGEIKLRLIAFSFREIDRAKNRINLVPTLNPTEARELYCRLLHAYLVEHDTAERFDARRAA